MEKHPETVSLKAEKHGLITNLFIPRSAGSGSAGGVCEWYACPAANVAAGEGVFHDLGGIKGSFKYGAKADALMQGGAKNFFAANIKSVEETFFYTSKMTYVIN